MNKRLLLSLYDRSGLGAYMPVDFKGHELQVEEHMEKFAELIVKECAKVAWRNTPDTEELEYSHLIKDKILEHFGVDE